MITDTHAHLYWDSFQADRGEVLERARAAGVGRMIIVGTDVATSHAAAEFCALGTELHPTAGIHPHDARSVDARTQSEMRTLCEREACVGIGETGLDYFKEYSPRDSQRASFRWHLELARELDKPVVVHSRDAHDETLALLRSVPGVRGVMHCYTLGVAELAPYLELGFYISFSGVVTYPKNVDNLAAARAVASERLLFETDAPFLAPQGRRGVRNEPAFIRTTVELVARERGVAADELATLTSRNAAELFRLPLL